jgi:hypothetical protein
MLRITVTDRARVDPVRTGVLALAVVRSRHPRELVWRAEFLAKLAGGRQLQRALDAGVPATVALLNGWRRDASRFQRATRQDRLYR